MDRQKLEKANKLIKEIDKYDKQRYWNYSS